MEKPRSVNIFNLQVYTYMRNRSKRYIYTLSSANTALALPQPARVPPALSRLQPFCQHLDTLITRVMPDFNLPISIIQCVQQRLYNRPLIFVYPLAEE